MRTFWRNNGLSIVLGLLFLGTLVGHAVAGWIHFNSEQLVHREEAVTFAAYLVSSNFLETVAENWESEFLQMLAFIVLTVFLFQKGSPESKDPDEADPVDEVPSDPPRDAPKAVRAGGWRLRLYSHSLSLAFLGLFLVSFVLHAWSGAEHYNQEVQAHGGAEVTVLQYLTKSQFWFESFQNWQSEFLAVFAMVVLAIWLRERGSAESKPVAAPHLANE